MTIRTALVAGLLMSQGALVHSQTATSDPDARARQIELQMSAEERVRLTHGVMALPLGDFKVPEGAPYGAGYIQGIPRLGVPALTETDASLGVAYIGGLRND
ncbi:MAG: glycosyl hydrolase, partial [Rhizorhabdus sp.]|nr:glycosyl hydrolase [Rhizorhabdus sp.]